MGLTQPKRQPALPRNAHRIIEMRRAGTALPNGVVVSYVGKTDLLAPHVYCDACCRYDWQFLRGLQTYLVTRAGIECSHTIAGLYDACDQMRVGYPLLIDIDRSIATHILGRRSLGMQWREDSPQWRQIFPIRLMDQEQRGRGTAA